MAPILTRSSGIDDSDRGRPDDADAVLPGGLDDSGGVLPRQALGQDVHQLDLAGDDGLDGGVLGAFARHGDEAGVDFGMLVDGLGDGVVDGHAVDVQAAAAGRHAGHDVRAVVEHLHRHPPALLARDALNENSRVFADQGLHRRSLCFLAWWMTMRAESATEVAMPRR